MNIDNLKIRIAIWLLKRVNIENVNFKSSFLHYIYKLQQEWFDQSIVG